VTRDGKKIFKTAASAWRYVPIVLLSNALLAGGPSSRPDPNMRPHDFGGFASLLTLSLYFSQVVTQELPPAIPVQYRNTAPGVAVKTGTKLRILPVGDSITVGWLGDDGNGYRKQLRDDLSGDFPSNLALV